MARSKATITEYRNYYLPPDFPCTLLSGDYWRISDIPSGRLHFHNCFEIGICHSDSGTLEITGRKYSFKEGDITCISKNIPHTTYSDSGTSSHWSYIFMDPAALFKNFLPSGIMSFDLSAIPSESSIHVFSKEDYPELHNLVLSVIRELEEKRPGYRYVVTGLLLSLYFMIWRLQVEKRPHNDSHIIETPNEYSLVLQPALNYIDEKYMESFEIEFLADLCHLSPTHFRRLFHSVINQSPLEFLNSTRIYKACELLRSTEDSILSVSEQVGFRTISCFNRCFAKIMQMTPREYRLQMLKKKSLDERQIILEFTGWTKPEVF